MDRFIIIGLDCGAPELFFDRYTDHLPNIRELMAEGVWGPLRSTDPPITVPAWSAMVTSKDPGQLGFYGFRNRRDHTYANMSLATSNHVREKTIWNYLSEAERSSLLVGVPQTYPPKPLRGMMVSCFLTPSKQSRWTYPSTFARRVDEAAGGSYVFDVDDFRRGDLLDLNRSIVEMTRTRFQTFRHFLKNQYCFNMVVEIGLDRMQHRFWRYADAGHPLYDPANPLKDALLDYHVLLDREIGKIVAETDKNTHLMVVSDHGAKPMRGALGINQFFINEGLLKLKLPVEEPTPLTPEMVEWKDTLCWGEGGYYGRVFLNIKGREPQGVLPADQVDAFCRRLRETLSEIPGPNGENIGTKVLEPNQIYRETRGFPPDLLVYFGNLDYRSAGLVGLKDIYLLENDTGLDDANHADQGILVWRPAAKITGIKREIYSIYDIAPTVLRSLGLSVPEDMIGTSLVEESSSFTGRT